MDSEFPSFGQTFQSRNHSPAQGLSINLKCDIRRSARPSRHAGGYFLRQLVASALGNDCFHAMKFGGRLSAKVLEPGGFLITYSGQYNLPDLLARLERHLVYFWMGSVHYTASSYRKELNLFNSGKPYLIYNKEPQLMPAEAIEDVIKGSGIEKDYHPWQQPVAEPQKFIRWTTKPGDKTNKPDYRDYAQCREMLDRHVQEYGRPRFGSFGESWCFAERFMVTRARFERGAYPRHDPQLRRLGSKSSKELKLEAKPSSLVPQPTP